MFWKDSLPKKKIALEYDLACITRKDGVSFYQKNNPILHTEKWNMSFSKKYMEIWYFLQIFWKDGLSDTMAVEYGLSCIIRKDNIYFSQKHDLII